jgi:hypothetical protein
LYRGQRPRCLTVGRVLAAKTANQKKEIREEYRPINVEYILYFVIIFLYFVLALLAKKDDHKT